MMAALVDRCTVNGEEVVPQPGGFYGGWITSRGRQATRSRCTSHSDDLPGRSWYPARTDRRSVGSTWVGINHGA